MKRLWRLLLPACLLSWVGSCAVVEMPAALAVSTISEPAICPVAVFAVLPVATGTPGATYAAFLSSPEGPGRASGTLWVNTRGGAFSVPFTGREVTNAPYTAALDPIVFTLPEAGALDNVFVSQLDDPTPGPCRIYNTWVPGITTHMRDDLRDRLHGAIPAAPVPIAALRIDDPDAACRSGDSSAMTALAVPPRNGPIHDPGRVFVRVRLAADSSVLDARVSHSEAVMNNLAALDATRESIFITQTRACRPQSADYTFIVIFQ